MHGNTGKLFCVLLMAGFASVLAMDGVLSDLPPGYASVSLLQISVVLESLPADTASPQMAQHLIQQGNSTMTGASPTDDVAGHVRTTQPTLPQNLVSVAPHIDQSAKLHHSLQLALFLAILVSFWLVLVRLLGKDSAEKTTHAQQGRLHILDNAKFLLVWMVVWIHMSSPFHGTLETAVHAFLNPFATRALCFISGVVSSTAPSSRTLRNIFFRYIVPLFAYIAIIKPLILDPVVNVPAAPWQGVPKSLGDYMKITVLHFKTTYYCKLMPLEWYICGLIWWQMSRFVLAPCSPASRLGLSLAVSAIAGYLPGNILALNWAMVMLPVFVAGQLFPMERALRQIPLGLNSVIAGSLLTVAIFMLSSFSLGASSDGNIMDGMPGFGWNGEVPFWNYVHPIFWLRGLFQNLVELTKCVTFILLFCPRSDGLLAQMGCRTLYPYLLQYLLMTYVSCSSGTCASWYMAYTHHFRWLHLFLGSCLITGCLTLWPITAIFGIFLEPVWLERAFIAISKRGAPLI